MTYICIDTLTAKVVPFIDACGREWATLESLALAARAIRGMNREAGDARRYRVETL